MNKLAGVVAAMVLLAAALHAGAQSGDVARDVARARAELNDAEIAYEKSLIVYLRCGGPSDDFDEAIRRQAKAVGVGDFTLAHTAGSEAVPATPFRLMRMQIHGRGEFGDVESLLHRITSLGLSRVLDFESVHLGEVRGRSVSLDGTVAMVCYDYESKAMEFRVPPGRTPEEVELAAYRGRLQQLRAATAAARELEARMQPRRFVDALLVLADVWGRGAVGVHDLRYTAPALTLQGMVLGAGAKAAVEGSLHDPRFELTRLAWSPAGDCHDFTASARLKPAAEPGEDALPMNMFVERDAKLCSGPPANTCCRAEGGAMASVAKRGSGPLTIHLRNADVSTLFLALNDVSPADGFIVEPDVTGRLSVDFDGVTMGEALEALRAAGVVFATPGPIHRICKTACGEPTKQEKQKHTGEPLALSITEGGVTDILRAFEEVSGLHIHVPRDLKGDVAVFVSEAPWDAVFDGLMAAFDRTYTIDGKRVSIGDRAAAVPLGELLSTPITLSSRSLVERDPNKIAAADFRLAGIAGTNGGTWKAYARVLGSSKFVFAAAPGASLLDAHVAAVAADRVTLRATGGRDVVVALP